MQELKSAEEYETKGLKFWHAINIQDVDTIQESGGKIIAPSFGVSKSVKPIERYGDIVFVVPPDMLKKIPIYTRDIWSATIRVLPERLYVPNKRSKAYSVLKKYRVFADSPEYNLDIWLKDSLGRDNPIEYLSSYGLMNEYVFDQNELAIARDLGLDVTEEDIYEGRINVSNVVAAMLFTELPRTPKNIARYMKLAYGAERGIESMFKGAQLAARKIPYKELEEYADKYLVEGDYPEDLPEKLFSDQCEARQKVHDLLELKTKREFEIYPSDEMAGEMAVAKTLTGLRRVLIEYGETPSRWSDNQLRQAHKILKAAYIEIPSEYFEAKSYDVYDINYFPHLITSNQDAIDKLKRMGYAGEVYPDYKAFWVSRIA